MAANPSIQLGTDGNWAIKEDNLLAYKQDGTRFFNKEFDFSRSSLATFVDKDGLIKVSGVTNTELVTNGTFDSDSDWTKDNAWSINNGKANCDGTQNSNANIYQPISFVVGKVYKVTYELSNVSSGSAKIVFGDTGGTLRSTNGIFTEYYTFVSGSNFYIQGNSSFTGSVDNISVVEVQTNVPRIDFKDDTTGHLLLESQSTNLVTYSEDFTQYTSSAATLESGYLAPDGSNNAYKVSGTVGTSSLYKFGVNPTSTATRTIYAKTVSGTGQAHLCSFNANTNNLFTITEDWQRFEVNGTTTTTGEGNFYAIDFRGSTNLSEVLIWGGQVEELSYATSYIPTSGSTVTRNGEVCNNSGSVQDFNSEQGVLYCEAATLVDPTGIMIIGLSDGTAANRISITFHSTLNRIQVFSQKNSSQLFNIDTTSVSKTNFNKIAISYSSTSAKLFVNGTLAASATPSDMFTANTLDRVNFDIGSGANDFYGKTKNLKVFKRAMSDGELYLLTVKQYQSYQEMATALNYTL